MKLSRAAIQSLIRAYQVKYGIELDSDQAPTLGLQLLSSSFQLMQAVDPSKLAIINQSNY